MDPLFPRPRLLVSKCLGYAACRFDGSQLGDDFLALLAPFVDVVTVCPEVEIGLGTPRSPVRLVFKDGAVRLVQPATGLDCTEAMDDFAARFLTGLEPIDGALLKYKSPSCGVSQVRVYEAPPEGVARMGRFAAALKAMRPHIALEDEARLKNFRLREHFLTKIFALARLREIAAAPSMDALRRFQEQYKYLLMAYHPVEQKVLGRIVANAEQRPLSEVVAAYSEGLYRALANQPKKSTLVNALQHVGGYFKHTSSERERRFLVDTLALFREGRIPLSTIIMLLKGWALRDQNEYLLTQVLMEPFPSALTALWDSGKRLQL